MNIYDQIEQEFKGEGDGPKRIVELLGYIGKVQSIEAQDNQMLVVYKHDNLYSDFTIVTAELYANHGLSIKGFNCIHATGMLHVWFSKLSKRLVK